MDSLKNKPVVVVLAAGRGSRFEGDTHKLAQPLGPSTVLEHTLSQVLASGLPMVVVTTAPLVWAAQRVVAARDIILLPPVGSASREPLGMGYSIAAGVAARAHANGWLILPGDLPLVRPDTLRQVAQALKQHPIAHAQYRGHRGHPVGLAAELYSELAALSGEEGARRILSRYPAQAIEVDDPGSVTDIDTVADLESVRLAVAATPGTVITPA